MSHHKTAFVRFLLLYLIWWILTEGDLTGTGFGIVVTAIVALLSVRLFPPSGYRLNPAGILAFSGYFLMQSIVAGIDVARRLISPRLPIQPGALTVTTLLPPGSPRWLLANTLSLMPGTLSVRIDSDQLEVHCLDTAQSIEQEIRRTERYLARLFSVEAPAHGGSG